MQDMCSPLYKKIIYKLKVDTNAIAYKAFQKIVVFTLIDFSWLFFRANSFTQGFKILKAIVKDFSLAWLLNFEYISIGDYKLQMIILISLIIMMIADYFHYKEINLKEILFKQQIVFRWVIYWTILMLILFWGAYGKSNGQNAFIYFQF